MKKVQLLLLILFLCPVLSWSVFVPYQGKMYSLKSEHFYIVYPKKFQDKAETVSDYAESIFENLQPLMKWKPKRRITVILTDHTDLPNGVATTFPENTIYLYMAEAGLSKELSGASNPLYTLLLHELTHILQLDQISHGAWFWRIFFSRAYFPLNGAFTWFHEGTAVYTESRYGAGGRLDSIRHKAIIDSFARNQALPDYERIVYPIVDYPYNNLAYHIGARFLDYLAKTYGEEKLTAFQKDFSNDFWPFIYEFVLKFKKHYGKSLKQLWNDWRNWEYSNIAKTQWQDESGLAQLPTNGNLISMVASDGNLIFSSNSLKDGNGIFRWNGVTGKKEKLCGNTAGNMCLYNGDILCTRNNITPGGFDSDDIFLFSPDNKKWKRLTYNKRITKMTYDENANLGVYFHHGATYLFSIEKGKICEREKIDVLDDFDFVNDFYISPNAQKILFSGMSNIVGNYLVCLYDIESETIEILSEIRGIPAGWLDNENFYFVGITHDNFTRLFSYRLQTAEVKQLFRGNDFVDMARYAGNENFYVTVYTSQGTQIRFTEKITGEIVTDLQWRANPKKPQTQTAAEVNKTVAKSGLYNPGRYLNPNWMILPYMLDYYFSLGGFNIPCITGGVNFYKTLPLGRFAYSLTVILDYINWYPQSSLSLTWKVPCTTLGYSFQTLRDGNIFQFMSQYSVTPSFSFDNENTFSFNVNATAFAYINSFNYAVLFTQQYGGEIQYSYLRKHPGAATWNCGMVATLSGVTAFADKHLEFAGVCFNAETRIPLKEHYLYITNVGGYNLLSDSNIFTVGKQYVSFNQSSPLGYKSGSFSKPIDMKSFSLNQNYKANAFIKGEVGALATLYRRSHYWNFLTVGFNAIHLRPFAEYALLRNVGEVQHLVGTGLEFIADFFVAYGNIPLSLVQGNAIGYEVGNRYPTYNGYVAFSLLL